MVIPRVILNIAGGVVQSIIADYPIHVWIVDWDNIEAGEEAGEGDVEVDPELVERQWGVVGTRDQKGQVIECE